MVLVCKCLPMETCFLAAPRANLASTMEGNIQHERTSARSQTRSCMRCSCVCVDVPGWSGVTTRFFFQKYFSGNKTSQEAFPRDFSREKTRVHVHVPSLVELSTRNTSKMSKEVNKDSKDSADPAVNPYRYKWLVNYDFWPFCWVI